MNRKRLSIIIPVYNVGAYLNKCVVSIIKQITADDEVLLIEDCSTDNSLSICKELAEQHPNIYLHRHNINKGLSEARNTGIKHAQGEYITFVDSDDFLEEDTLKVNMDIIAEHNDVDILEYPVSVHHFSDKCYRYTPGENIIETYKQWLMRKGHRHSYAWNKIYRRQLWDGTEFPPRKRVEDLYTIPYIIEKAQCIYASNIGTYYYCQRNSSICTRASLPFYHDHLEASALLFQHIKEQSIADKHFLDILYCETCDSQIVFFQNGGKDCLLPAHTISATSIFHAKTLTQLFKMALMLLLRGKYPKAMARIRNKFIHQQPCQ
jgi:glycosyltransferase involved in cell wall biosynthesis